MNKGLIVAVAIFGIGVIAAPFCTTVVPGGYVGAVYDKMEKGVQDEVLGEGFHLKSPFEKVKDFPISIETIYMSKDEREGSEDDESINTACKDGSVNADLTFSYRFEADRVPELQRKYRGRDGNDIVETVLRGQLRTWVSEVTKNYNTIEVYMDKREEVNTKLVEYFNKRGDKYGIKFENVSLAEVRVSKEVQEAMEKRQKISQELEQQKMNLKKAEIAKEEEKLKQEKALIKAKGERQANEEKSKGLNDKVLKEMAINKWDGKLPQATNGNAILMK